MNSKGFRDEDGNNITIPGTSVKYGSTLRDTIPVFGEDGILVGSGVKALHCEDTAGLFEESDVSKTILVAGTYHILYEPTTNNPAISHILYVRNYKAKPTPLAAIKNWVEQCLVNKDGICLRRCAFNDEEHTEVYSDWTEWKSLIPSVTNTIEEDNADAASSGAVYAALAGVQTVLAGKEDSLRTLNISYDSQSDAFSLLSSDKTLINDFIASAPRNQLVPVIVTLYSDLYHEGEGEVIGLAKWDEGIETNNPWVSIEVSIGKYKYTCADYTLQDMTEWTRAAICQSFL